ncbi:MAG TPA: hypothetical protein EYO73_04040 [Sulfurimonas sp.]|nr:hypothetical protein [Sulfurimonas sp.]
MKKLLLSILILGSSLIADHITFWQINKVRSNDVLNIRSESIYTSKKISTIPFNEICVKNYGCGKDIELEPMMKMQEDEVKAFLAQAQEGWCFIEYQGNKGWVNKTFVKESTRTCN